MVKLQRVKDRYFFSVPKEKVMAKKWKGGEHFDVNFGPNGELVFKEIV